MIKTLTTMLMLSMASCSMSPAYAQTKTKTCSVVQEVSTTVATLRDQGSPAGKVFQFLVMAGMTEDAAYDLVLVVYTNLKGSSPEDVGSLYYKACAGEPL